MALNTDNILISVLNILRTNTATIAASLTSCHCIGLIRSGIAPISLDEYPAIIIKLPSKTEEFNQKGERKNKHELLFDIIPMISYEIGSSESDKDVRKMVRGIKQVLKNNITLSSTVYWSIPEIVDYFPFDYDGIFCSAARIIFKTFVWST